MKNKIKELREEFNQKLDALELEIIGKEIDEMIKEKKNPLVPEIGQRYWIIDEYLNGGYNNYCGWDNDDLDKRRLAIGNMFLTEQEAKDEIEKRRAIKTIKMYITEHFSFEPDWGDNNEKKYKIYYNNINKIFSWNFNYSYQHQTQIGYLKSQEDCDEIMDKFEDELKIIFNIK